MKASDYMEETENAVMQLLEGLAFYRDIMKSDPKPVFVASVNPDGKGAWQEQLENWLQENDDKIDSSLQKQREYFGYTFSQGTLAGAILQIACMGISVFSTNNVVPDTCKKFVKPGSNHVKFCCGRKVCNLPIGIIILAARNQYNHWDDPKPRPLTINVFNKIAKTILGRC